ncbi:MAG: metallophosphoesterase, partial [Desulfatiglandales bacterium]
MEVCHIALSDLHIGEEDSILTPPAGEKESAHEDYWRPLGDFFESVISKNRRLPTLILLGDVVEFALSDPLDSQRLFFGFLRYLLIRRGLFGRVIYLPGNHDHHIWELSKEAQYVSYVNRKGSVALKERPWNRTKAYVTKDHHFVTPYFWQGLMDDGVDIKILYPNYFLGDEEGKLLIAFHHGHFLEPTYILLSRLKRLLFGEEIPSGIDTLEEENGPWIEFLFSSFGFSGEVGKRAETLYELLQSERGMERFLLGISSRLLGELRIRGPLNRLLDFPFSLFLRYLLRLVYRGHERKRPSELFSKELESGLQWYINYPLKAQLFE